MALNLLTLALIGATALGWSLKLGLLGAWIHLLITVIAGCLAVALWEPLVLGVLLAIVPAYAWGLGLLGLFGFWLVALHCLARWTLPDRLRLHRVVDVLGAVVCGLLAGAFSVGLVIIGLSLMPLPTALLGGYQPLRINTQGQIQRNTDRDLWLPVDRLSAKVLSMLSDGAFRSSHPLALHRPELAKQAALAMVGREPTGCETATPSSVEVVGVLAWPTPIPQLDPQLAQALGARYRSYGKLLVGVITQWDRVPEVLDQDGVLRVRRPQIRLVTHRAQPNTNKIHAHRHTPIGWSRVKTPNGQRVFLPYRRADQAATASYEQGPLAWVFLVSGEDQPHHLLVRHLRLPLPAPDADADALLAVLGQLDDTQTPNAPTHTP